MASELLLRLRRVSKSYGLGTAEVAALRSVSFDVAAGEFVAIMGASGSGKSTLMNLIGLLDRPTSGQLVLLGREVHELSPDAIAAMRNQKLGFVFQSYCLLARSTALENVELPLIYAGIGKRERRRRAGEALASVGLAKREAHWPAELSGGEQQRVAIARALVTDPALVLADEPTGALDTHTGSEILAIFRTINQTGRSIIMITHDEVVARYAARIIRLQDGNIVSDERLRPSEPAGPELGPAVGAAR